MANNFLVFLGTGGSRHVMAEQLRSTGGTYFELEGERGIFDPGPGALGQLIKNKPPLNPENLSTIILSHGHIDHCNDVNLIIDSMTRGGLKKKGTLFAPGEIIEGKNQVLFNYLKPFLFSIEKLKPCKQYSVGELNFSTSVLHQHGMETYGFSFFLEDGKLSFITDTSLFPGLDEYYSNSRWLVLNLVLEKNCGNAQHLDIKEAEELLKKIQPEVAVITHFGRKILRKGPEKVADYLEKETGIKKVIAAQDGGRFDLK